MKIIQTAASIAWTLISSVFVCGLLLSGTASLADPVVQPNFPLPEGLYCFRITDIDCPTTTTTCSFEFEILNWSNVPVTGLRLSRTDDGSHVKIESGSVDANGRPIGSGSDRLNFVAVNGCNVDSCVDDALTNVWEPSHSSGYYWDETEGALVHGITSIWYKGSNASALENRDLIGPNDPSQTGPACDLIPGCSLDISGTPTICDEQTGETVDNGCPAVDLGPTNALDGFVVEFSNFEEGATISLNWDLYHGNHANHAVFGSSPFGHGVFNFHRTSENVEAVEFLDGRPLTRSGPAMWTGPTGANGGTHNHPRDMHEYHPGVGTHFEVELGVGLTAPYGNAEDDIGPPVNAQRIRAVHIPTMEVWGMFALIALLLAAGLRQIRLR